jgi:hypothetical protein
MCGGGATSTTTSNAKGGEFNKKASKRLIRAGEAYGKEFGTPTTMDQQALGGIQANAALAEGYMPYQDQMINYLYQGGGMGEGQNAIRDSYNQAAPAYQRFLGEDYLDPMSNPYLQPAIESARSDAFNNVAQRFHKAGRSFSGSEAGAFGDAATSAALPMLLGQYNQNVGHQMGAAGGLLGGALGASSGLDASQTGVLKSMMAAPGQIQGLNIPENMLLDIENKRRNMARDALQTQAGIIGATKGSPTQMTSTTTQNSDPFQTILGGGLGLLGMFL